MDIKLLWLLFAVLAAFVATAVLTKSFYDFFLLVKQRLHAREIVLEQPPTGEYIVVSTRNCMFRIGDTLPPSTVSQLIDRGIDIRITKGNQ